MLELSTLRRLLSGTVLEAIVSLDLLDEFGEVLCANLFCFREINVEEGQDLKI